MKKALSIFIIGIIFLSILSLLIIPVSAETKEPVIIGFKDKPNSKLVKSYGGEIIYTYTITKAIAAKLTPRAIQSLAKNKDVAFIERDHEVKAVGEILPWGVDHIDADVVHSYAKGSGIKVAVIDTGINYRHRDLKANYKGGYDFVNNDNNPMDDHGHGTHCAGIIAAVDNDIGVIGVAPEAHLYGVKVLDRGGFGSSLDVIAGIEWSITNNMDIISMSLGIGSYDEALHVACNGAYAAGIIIVAAAGNSGYGEDTVIYPAKHDSVIAVAATDSNNVRASFSSTGPAVELSAPGVSIYSTLGNKYGTKSGTSMACPHVAGTAALVLSSDPQLTNVQVRERLNNTAEDLGEDDGKDNLYGYGLVDAEAATFLVDQSPTVEITYPTEDSIITGSITITASASDDKGIDEVKYKIDEGSYKPMAYDDVQENWYIDWDTTSESEGTHTITVQATDTKPQTSIDTVDVIVDNIKDPLKSMHIDSIDMWSEKVKGKHTIYTEVTIVDADGNVVGGVTVSLKTTTPNNDVVTDSRTTDKGIVTFLYGPTRTKGTYTSEVTNVVKVDWTYVETANEKTSINI